MVGKAKEGPPSLEPGTVSLGELVDCPLNPKLHDLGAIHVSMDAFGFLDRVVINRVTGNLLSGHGRRIVLLQKQQRGDDPPENIEVLQGDWQVPVDYVSIPAEHEGAVVVALNRAVELGGWDEKALGELLADIAHQDGNLWATGFDGDDLDRMLMDFEGVAQAAAQLDRALGGTIKTGAYGDKARQIKPVLYSDQVAVFEQAMQLTAIVNRGEALIAICQFYLDHHAKG
jgi:hypothetical protein